MLLGLALSMLEGPRVHVMAGDLEGKKLESGVRLFAGVPFAAPPVGDLRWREPQPVRPWAGVRKADAFASRPAQLSIYSDMVWRSPGVSEDCLYLNVWTPEKGRRLPVLVYFYGGGFQAGASDEPRYDGEAMAQKGVVSITVNYRLGVFGFLAHPELTRESAVRASGNYGLLDQNAALRWVRENVAAFGGDPQRVTIGGESAGSFSVSAQMASPLSRGLIAGAIGESGAALRAPSLAEAEKNGEAFAAKVGATSLAALRAIPTAALLDAAKGSRFGVDIDGWFLPKSPLEIYGAGQQAHVPLLAGWNTMEGGPGSVLGSEPATVEGLARAVRRLYPDRADEALRAYPATTDAEAKEAATNLASDRFIAYGTWKWIDLASKTGGKPVYRYLYAQPRPGTDGAGHSYEIEYALGNLDRNRAYAWTDDDRRLSATMLDLWSNFVKTGNPNGKGVPVWLATNRSAEYLFLAPQPRVETDRNDARHRFMDR